jgi:sec-independent protein translocase protein TatC
LFWRFATLRLKARERKCAFLFVSVAILFFETGVAIAYCSFGHATYFLEAISGKTLGTYFNPNQHLSLFLLMMFIFGVAFGFPVVLVAIELGGLVTPCQLLKSWRYAIIAITVASAVFTPSGDLPRCWPSRSHSWSSTSRPLVLASCARSDDKRLLGSISSIADSRRISWS